MITLLTVLSILLSSPAQADPPPKMSEKEAIKILTHDLEPYVHTLTRDVYVYNWAYRPKTGINSLNPHSADAEKYIRDRTEYLFTQGDWEGAATGGFYGAADPVSTRAEYGGGDPVLFQIKLRSGAHFIDLEELEISQEMIKTLQSFDCHAQVGSNNGVNYFQFPKTRTSAQCKKLFDDLFHEFKIVGFRYRYGAARLKNCEPDHTGAGAMVLGNEALIQGDWNSFIPDQFESENHREMEIIHSVFSFQDSDWPVESPFFHLPAQSRESQMRAVLQRGLPAAEDRISENFFNCNSYKYPEDIWRASWPEYLTWLGKTMGDLRKVTQELTLKNKHLVDIQRMTESKNVQVLDHYRKLAVLPLSAQSIERLAQAISPGNQYAPDLQSTPVPTPTPGSANCPPGTPMLPAKVGPISAVGLSQILAQFNHAVGPPQDLGKQVPALVDAVRAFLRLKPFREKNSEIASAILQLSLEKLGVPATHRLVWDDELSHRPEVLLKSLEEEITRRTYNADMCLFYYRYPISSGYGGLKKLLNSSDCGMVPLPAK